MKRRLLALLVLLAAPVHPCAASGGDCNDGEDARKPLSDEELWDRYYDYVKRLCPHGMPVEREEHAAEIEPKILLRGHRDDTTFTEYLVTMGAWAQIVLELDGYTGELRSYGLWSLLKAHPELSSGARPERVEPKLTRREVRKIAEKYLSLNTGIELKEYRIKVWYQETYWFINVQRCLDGVPFRIDAICLRYSEMYGLFKYQSTLFSEECDVKAKVSKEQAITLSRTYVSDVQAKTGARFRPVMAEVNGPMIVNPATASGIWSDNKPFSELRKTRLAWTVDYYDEDAARAGALPGCISLYIDGITGDLLGYKTLY